MDRTFPESVARSLIARAIELDQLRTGSMSLAELRTVAAEIGVSETALDAAVQELQELERARAAEAELGPVPAPATILALAGGGAAIGAANGLLEAALPHAVNFPFAVGTLLMLSGGVAVFEKRRKLRHAVVAFQLKNGGAWLGFGASWAVTVHALGVSQTGFLAPGPQLIASVTGVVWAFSSAVGGAVGLWRARPSSAGARPAHPDPESRLRRRVAARLKKWIDIALSRIRVAAPQGPVPGGAVPGAR